MRLTSEHFHITPRPDQMPFFHSPNWNFIFYRRPELSRMRFFSVEPLELDVTLLSTGEESEGGDALSQRARALCRADFSKETPIISSNPSLPVDQVYVRLSYNTLITPQSYLPLQMNLAHDLDRIIQRVTTGQRNTPLRIASKRRLAALFESSLIPRIFSETAYLRGLCVSMLYGLCNIPAPSFPLTGTRLKDLSASGKADVSLCSALPSSEGPH